MDNFKNDPVVIGVVVSAIVGAWVTLTKWLMSGFIKRHDERLKTMGAKLAKHDEDIQVIKESLSKLMPGSEVVRLYEKQGEKIDKIDSKITNLTSILLQNKGH